MKYSTVEAWKSAMKKKGRMIKSDDKGYYYEDMLGFRHYYNPQTDYPENDTDVTQTAVPPNEWKKYTTGVTSTSNVTKIEFQDLPQTAAPGKYSKASITKQILAHERVMRAIKQGLKVIFRRDNIINDKRVTEEKILNPGKKGMPEYIVKFTGRINADGSLINDEWITFRYPALPGDKEKKEEEEKVTAGSGAPIGGGGVDNGPSGGGSGGGGGSNGPSGDEDGYTGGPTDDIKVKYLLKPWLAKLPETEDEVVVSDTRQPDDYPGDDLIDIFDEQAARRSHGPNAPIPQRVWFNGYIRLEDLYRIYSGDEYIYEGLKTDGSDFTRYRDALKLILNSTPIWKLSTLSPYFVNDDDDLTSHFQTRRNLDFRGNRIIETMFKTGDFLHYRKSELMFRYFVSLIAHEAMHGLVLEQLEISHNESEVIAHLLNLVPDELFQYLKSIFPDIKLPNTSLKKYSVVDNYYPLIPRLKKLIEYYYRLDMDLRKRWIILVNLAILYVKNFLIRFGLLLPSGIPDFVTILNH
jgi:hypothetical protein